MLALLAMLLAFMAGAWSGMLQWWESLPLCRRFAYIGLILCFAVAIISRFEQINPLLLLAGLILLCLLIYGIRKIIRSRA
jgi:hypothetical protein